MADVMGTKTIVCPRCKGRVQVTLSGTQHRCDCGCVIQYSSESNRHSSGGRGDHKGEHGRRRRALSSFLNRKGSSNNSSSTSNSFHVNSSSSPVPITKSSSSRTMSPMLAPFGLVGSARGGGSRPNKRALLCGVSYSQHKHKLKGTRNDVINMKGLLTDTFGYPSECIRILSEDDSHDQEQIPTKKNIENSLKWLVEGCQSGDRLVFYFSGHGLRQPDFHDDEIDGFDETICPVDFMTEGMILDNDINKTIVWPLKEGVTLHAIVDACHSGTILDLEYVYNRKEKKWEDNIPPSRARKGTNGGLAISLSACSDDKLASDTTAFSAKVMNGAMTYIFTKIINSNPNITYGNLLEEMADEIANVNHNRCVDSRFFRKLFRDKIIQEPLLSSSKKFEVKDTKITSQKIHSNDNLIPSCPYFDHEVLRGINLNIFMALTGKVMNGAMTYVLTKTVIIYGDLLDTMADGIENVNRDGCVHSRFLRKVFRHTKPQAPLLSSSKQFGVYDKAFIL